MNRHPEWFRNRGYIHFDAPIGHKKAASIVTNPEHVSRHSFYPLLSYVIETLKIFKNVDGKVEKKKKPRKIAYASHLDSHIYAFYAQELSARYEHALNNFGLTECVLAFRSLGKSNIHFANDAFEEIKRRKNCTAIGLDISGFFDNLDHAILKEQWCSLLGGNSLPDDHFNVFRSVTRFSFVSRDEAYEKFSISKHNPKNGKRRICEPAEFRRVVRGEKLIETNTNKIGIPQGSPISALLSNIYMIDFDVEAKKIADRYDGRYFRYCDDMLFIVPTAHKSVVEKEVTSAIESVKLDINSKKTEIRDFWQSGSLQVSNRPLQYLGFIFDGQQKLIRSAALAKFSGKMKSGVRLAKKSKRKANDLEETLGLEQSRLFKRKLYERYSHLSRRNFITYGHHAAKIMQSKGIRMQLKPLWSRLQTEME